MDKNMKRAEILDLLDKAQKLLDASSDNKKRLLDIYHGLLQELHDLENYSFYNLQSLSEDELISPTSVYGIEYEMKCKVFRETISGSQLRNFIHNLANKEPEISLLYIKKLTKQDLVDEVLDELFGSTRTKVVR